MMRLHALAGPARPDRVAFEDFTDGRGYFTAPGFAGVPYVCLRLPSGSGKTLLAAHAIGVVGRGSDRAVEVSTLLPRMRPITEVARARVRYYVPREVRDSAVQLRNSWAAGG